jgi:hypothetical protein
MKEFLLTISCSLICFNLTARPLELEFFNNNCLIQASDSVKVTTIETINIDGGNVSFGRIDTLSIHFTSNNGIAANGAQSYFVETGDRISTVVMETAGLGKYFFTPSFFIQFGNSIQLKKIKTMFLCASPNNEIPPNMINILVTIYDEHMKEIPYTEEKDSSLQRILREDTQFFYKTTGAQTKSDDN